MEEILISSSETSGNINFNSIVYNASFTFAVTFTPVIITLDSYNGKYYIISYPKNQALVVFIGSKI